KRCRVGKGDFQAIIDIRASRRWGLPPAAEAGAASASAPTEQSFEDVSQVDVVASEAFEIAGGKAARARPTGAAPKATAAEPAAAKGHGRVAVSINLTPIEAGTLVLVGQQVIG